MCLLNFVHEIRLRDRSKYTQTLNCQTPIAKDLETFPLKAARK